MRNADEPEYDFIIVGAGSAGCVLADRLSSSIYYVTEACFERVCPGQGDLPLEELIAALPSNVIIGLETPMRTRFLGGADPVEVLAPCVAAVRGLMAMRSGGRGA